MARIVKSLSEAVEKGFINDLSKQNQQMDIPGILKEVNKIIEGVKDLRGMSAKNNPSENFPVHLNSPLSNPIENQKHPIVEINPELFNQLVSELINTEIAPNYANLTLKEAQEKYNNFEPFIIPKIKEVILKIVRVGYK